MLQLNIKRIQVHLPSFNNLSDVLFNGLHEIGSELSHELRLDQFLVYLLEVNFDGLILHLRVVLDLIDDPYIDVGRKVRIYIRIEGMLSFQALFPEGFQRDELGGK